MTDTVDIGTLAQHAAETHLDACFEAMNLFDESYESGEEPPESSASAPFCGCSTCVVREVLWAAWPIFEEHTG